MMETTDISLSYFKSQYDNKPKRLDFRGWAAFVTFLEGLSKRKLAKKTDAELICPAVYHEGTTRANANVLGWAGWAAIDIDEFEGDLDVFLNRFSDWDYVVYSTASSKPDGPKFRLVFRLTRFVAGPEVRKLWFALQSWVDDEGDKQCKDLSRMYYIPAEYDDAYNFFSRNSGIPVDVDYLYARYPLLERDTRRIDDELPDDVIEGFIQYRKDKMDANYTWTSFHDCPFWPSKLEKEYRQITKSGWYRKMYQIMVSIAVRAHKKGYPITAIEMADLCQEFDLETGRWYEDRPFVKEAERALEYAKRNT